MSKLGGAVLLLVAELPVFKEVETADFSEFAFVCDPLVDISCSLIAFLLVGFALFQF